MTCSRVNCTFYAKSCSFTSNPPSTLGDLKVNRRSPLACHNPTYLTGPYCRFAPSTATTNTCVLSAYNHRQHQNVSAKCTSSFQFSIILSLFSIILSLFFYYCHHKVKCLVQFHAVFPQLSWNSVHRQLYQYATFCLPVTALTHCCRYRTNNALCRQKFKPIFIINFSCCEDSPDCVM